MKTADQKHREENLMKLKKLFSVMAASAMVLSLQHVEDLLIPKILLIQHLLISSTTSESASW